MKDLEKLKRTAARYAADNGGNAAYSNGPVVILAINGRYDANHNAVADCEHHICGSSAAASAVAERVFSDWRLFPHLGQKRVLEVCDERIQAARRFAMRCTRRRAS